MIKVWTYETYYSAVQKQILEQAGECRKRRISRPKNEKKYRERALRDPSTVHQWEGDNPSLYPILYTIGDCGASILARRRSTCPSPKSKFFQAAVNPGRVQISGKQVSKQMRMPQNGPPVTLKVTLCERELFSPSTMLLAEHSTVRVRPTQSGWTTSERQPAPNFVSLSRMAGLRVTSGAGFPRAVQRSSSPTDKDDVFGVNFTSLAPSTRTHAST